MTGFLLLKTDVVKDLLQKRKVETQGEIVCVCWQTLYFWGFNAV